MTKKQLPIRKPKAVVPTTLIQKCTFTGSDSAGVIALAEALKANAQAIQALCGAVRTPQPMIYIEGVKKNEDTGS